ncbi:ribonuclease III [Gracilimonas mengyeensis]|uniref:Ribonuclease 3 n=1 Tax=Gracilimonas mengyeensis TaxID=1302730 RepID=A0A521DT16_9BACT|nr:ribonuclease III [Gracilimonas mengyeensis]SMO74844.1 ribonuclease-3 [Gracilimonas mengyeensis]
MPKWFRSLFSKPKQSTSELSPELINRIKKIEGIVGFSIDDPSLFLKALRHRSTLSQEQYETYDSYERLEFLGDAVLDLIAAEILFNKYPEKDEGFLTKVRAKLVRGETLSGFSRALGIEDLMELGERNGGGISKSILADAFESIIAAIYITQGYEHAYEFVDRVIRENLVLKDLIDTVDNYKSALLEYAQAKKMSIPYYEMIAEYGPGHNRTFEVKVLIDKRELGTGKGKSKKKAEQKAAKEALKMLKKE